MSTSRIAWLIVGRALLFLVIGGLAGALFGLCVGGSFGVSLGALLCCVDLYFPTSPALWRVNLEGTLYYSLMCGMGVGAACGSIAGAILFPIIQVARGLSPRNTPHVCTGFLGAWNGSIICATAGALSGTLIVMAVSGQRGLGTGLHAAFAPLAGGFFWGSVAGFVLGFFVGGWLGGMNEKHWINKPLRQLVKDAFLWNSKVLRAR